MKININEKTKIFANNLDQKCVKLLREISKENPDSIIRVMPDYHLGKNCIIGTTMTITDKINPEYVGSDIGCGIAALFIEKNININFIELDEFIRKEFYNNSEILEIKKRFENYTGKITKHSTYSEKEVLLSIGRVGSGNHFIEISETDENYAIVVHSGSGAVGKAINSFWSKKSEETNGYLNGKDMQLYLKDMKSAQKIAELNRCCIIRSIAEHLDVAFKKENYIENVHNYISDDNVLRKGAISSKKGEKLLIPINMKDGIIFGEGKGNEDWNNSAPHGAGRVCSRGEAKELITLEEFEESMKGIFTTCVKRSTLSEAPIAYRNLKTIAEEIVDTVEIKKILRPIYNFKNN